MLCDPGDHFEGRFEVERKYSTVDMPGVRGKAEALGARAFALGNSDLDIYFDMPDGQLEATGRQQILRLMQPSGRVLWIVKGPEESACVAMNLDDFGKAHEMIAALDYQETIRLEKQRDIYFLGAFHLTLDTVPGLGTFVEISVMTDDESASNQWHRQMIELAEQLGLKEVDRRRQSYREMLGL